MNIVTQNEFQIVINFNKDIVEVLKSEGYEIMTSNQKNELIVNISMEKGILFNEVTPELIIQYHKDIKKAEMNQKCDDTICGGFTATNGHTYRTNRDDQTNMIGQKDELNEDPTILVVPWKTEDSGYINHTREEWLSIYSQAFQFKKQQLFKYDKLKKDIAAATSHPEIIDIKWV
jgi:hypothetical protein